MNLVLFDIDGTLIRDDGAARDAFAEALKVVYDREPPLDQFDFSGRTDPEITWMVLENSGLTDEEIDRGLEALWRTYLDGLRSRVSRDTVRLMPGIEPLLQRLVVSQEVELGLLTGNIEPGARAKLSPFDLNRFFEFGAFGSDSRFRAELPPVALERARTMTGYPFEMEDLIVIGDSIHDVRCVAPHGARAIAVSTGVTSGEMLRAENPHHFFETLENTEEVWKVVVG